MRTQNGACKHAHQMRYPVWPSFVSMMMDQENPFSGALKLMYPVTPTVSQCQHQLLTRSTAVVLEISATQWTVSLLPEMSPPPHPILSPLPLCLRVMVGLSVCLSACLPICLSVYLSDHSSVCLSIHPSVHYFICLPALIPASQSNCLSFCLSV